MAISFSVPSALTVSGLTTASGGLKISTLTGILSASSGTVSIASTTGTGNVVLDTSPTLVTPVLGVASATSLALGTSGISIGSVANATIATSGNLTTSYLVITPGSAASTSLNVAGTAQGGDHQGILINISGGAITSINSGGNGAGITSNNNIRFGTYGSTFWGMWNVTSAGSGPIGSLSAGIGASSFSAVTWGTTGLQLNTAASTYTNTSTIASGTAPTTVLNSFAAATLSATNTGVVTTNAATVYIAGGPIGSANNTITNSYGLWNVGKSRFDSNIQFGGTANATIGLSADSTTGNLVITPPSSGATLLAGVRPLQFGATAAATIGLTADSTTGELEFNNPSTSYAYNFKTAGTSRLRLHNNGVMDINVTYANFLYSGGVVGFGLGGSTGAGANGGIEVTTGGATTNRHIVLTNDNVSTSAVQAIASQQYNGTARKITNQINFGTTSLTAGAENGYTAFSTIANGTLVEGLRFSIATASPNNTVNAVVLAANATSTNADLVLTAKGTGAYIFGDVSATTPPKRGARAVDFSYASGSTGTGARGDYSFAVGLQAQASAGTTHAVAIGNSAAATADNTLAIGPSATAGGQNSVALGYRAETTAGNTMSVLDYSYATVPNSFAQGVQTPANPAKGSNQTYTIVLGNDTTNATTTELFSSFASGRATIASNHTWLCSIDIVGTKSGGGDQVGFSRTCLLKNQAGTVSLVGSVQTIGTDFATAGAATWSTTISADNTNKSLKVEVTGQAATNIRWTAKVSVVQALYN